MLRTSTEELHVTYSHIISYNKPIKEVLFRRVSISVRVSVWSHLFNRLHAVRYRVTDIAVNTNLVKNK